MQDDWRPVATTPGGEDAADRLPDERRVVHEQMAPATIGNAAARVGGAGRIDSGHG